MPELPEVETIRRGLEGRVEGLEILQIEASGCRIFQIDPALLADALEGERFTALERLGKFLIFSLPGQVLVVHLGMTGQLTLRDPATKDADGFLRHPVTGLQRVRQHAPDKHTHLQIHFDNGPHCCIGTFGCSERSIFFPRPRRPAIVFSPGWVWNLSRTSMN